MHIAAQPIELRDDDRTAPFFAALMAAALATYGLQLKRPRGRPHSWDGMRSEIGIIVAVYLIARGFGLELTRSPASKRVCAASILAEALTQHGIPTREKRINELLTKWRKWAAANFRVEPQSS
jgi:hypothetical protein